MKMVALLDWDEGERVGGEREREREREREKRERERFSIGD